MNLIARHHSGSRGAHFELGEEGICFFAGKVQRRYLHRFSSVV
jgi:hypothetical protein